MDRREALKKLGVGGAVAVSAPVLLDAFNVAHAATNSLLTDVLAAVGTGTSWIATSTRNYPTDKKSLTYFAPASNPVTNSSVAFSYSVSNGYFLSATSGTSTTVTRGGTQLGSFSLTVTVTWTRGAESVNAVYRFDFAPGTGNNYTFIPSVVSSPA